MRVEMERVRGRKDEGGDGGSKGGGNMWERKMRVEIWRD